MDTTYSPNRLWETKFSRRQKKFYHVQDRTVIDELREDGTFAIAIPERPRIKLHELREASILVQPFLKSGRSGNLDPSTLFDFCILREYLASANVRNLRNSTSQGVNSHDDLILLDDRRDTTGGPSASRVWDSDEYLKSPPCGENVFVRALNPPDFVSRLRTKRLPLPPNGLGAERRTMYLANPSPSSMLALVATVAPANAAILRDFLDRHVASRAFFGATTTSAFMPEFVFEFHIPFFSLRRGPGVRDLRSLQDQTFRKSSRLPLPRNDRKIEEQDCFHEAQVSMLLHGVDEWVWTAYCCVDTYFGSEPDHRTYYDGFIDDHGNSYGFDAPSGGLKELNFPTWNPREYFLMVLARRMMQATREWTNLVLIFQERLTHYEESTSDDESGMRFPFVDDRFLSKTKQLTWAVSTLQRFRDSLARTIVAWDNFASGEIDCFNVNSGPALQDLWQGYLAEIRGYVSELRSLQLMLTQKLELFKEMKNGLTNASSLRESAAATRQNENIGVLTRMTVLYLPASLASSLFSIAMVPSETPWWAYVIVLCVTTAITLFAASKPRILNHVFRIGDQNDMK